MAPQNTNICCLHCRNGNLPLAIPRRDRVVCVCGFFFCNTSDYVKFVVTYIFRAPAVLVNTQQPRLGSTVNEAVPAAAEVSWCVLLYLFSQSFQSITCKLTSSCSSFLIGPLYLGKVLGKERPHFILILILQLLDLREALRQVHFSILKKRDRRFKLFLDLHQTYASVYFHELSSVTKNTLVDRHFICSQFPVGYAKCTKCFLKASIRQNGT